MTRRLTILLVLVAIVSGCDLVTDDAPATFEASYTGARSASPSGTLAGSLGYTAQRRYVGLGSSDTYVITLCKSDLDYNDTERCNNKITLSFEGIGQPSGDYRLYRSLFEGARPAGASLTVDGFIYYFPTGKIDVVAEHNRLRGSFQFSDGFVYYVMPGVPFEADFPVDLTRVVMDGRFDVPVRD